MKRLLCIVSSLNTGGAETFLVKLLDEIDKKSYGIDFVVNEEGIYDKEVISLGSRIYNIPLRTKNPIKAFIALQRIVSMNQYNYVLKLCDTPIGLFDVLAARLGGAKVVGARSCNASSDSNTIKNFVMRIIRPLFNASLSYKIAPSKLAANYTFGEKCVKKGDIKYIHNGLDCKKYTYNVVNRERIRTELGINDKFVIGHIGRFVHQKNHTFLIKVIAQVIRCTNKDIVLVLVGDGEKREDIINQVEKMGIKESVLFTGVRRDIPELLSSFDLFALPSLYEGMPNTAIEAQAAGLRCLLADTVTKEANITGLVRYLSLDNMKSWVDEICTCAVGYERKDYSSTFSEKEYDIESVCKSFKDIVFAEL